MHRRALIALAAPAALTLPGLRHALAQATGQNGAETAQSASKLDRIFTDGRLRIGTTGDFRPISFRDPATGDYAGYDIDIMRKLASEMGVRPEFVSTDWDTLLDGLRADKYDLTTTASMTVERARAAAFSLPSIEFGTVPMTLKDNLAQFDGWDSINKPGITVAVTRGTVFDAQARSFFPNAEIRTVEPPARDFQEVLAGRSLVSVTSNVEAAALTEIYQEIGRISIDEPRARRPGAFLMARDDQIWINFVDSWILMNRSTDFFFQLQNKWQLN